MTLASREPTGARRKTRICLLTHHLEASFDAYASNAVGVRVIFGGAVCAISFKSRLPTLASRGLTSPRIHTEVKLLTHHSNAFISTGPVYAMFVWVVLTGCPERQRSGKVTNTGGVKTNRYIMTFVDGLADDSGALVHASSALTFARDWQVVLAF